MADGPVYRAVFIRMHPTGKAVLSLSEASQGREAELVATAADELGIPPENVAINARRLRDKPELIAALMLDAAPDSLQWEGGHWSAGGRSARMQEVSLRAFGADALPDGVEGSLDAQPTYRLAQAQPAG